MIIGYDAKRAFRNNTGLGNYSRMLIGGVWNEGCRTKNNVWANNDLPILLYTPSVKGRHEHYFDKFKKNDEGANNDLPVLKVVAPKGVWRLLKSVWRSVGVSCAVKHDGVELFHGLSHELPYGLPKRVKKVVTMHDLIVMRFPEFFKPADRVIHRLKMRHACRVADVVVAISEQTKRDLVELMGIEEEKIRVVYQSCDSIFWIGGKEIRSQEVRSKYGLPERYILCAGTLEERKNQMRVIEAMKRLPEEVALVLVGRPRGTYGQQILQSASDRIRLLSKADFADFPALYNGAVASVYMSRFEGFGIPVLESMCCDCPVLTSDVSSMPEAGGDAALYAAPDDVEAIARQLLRLCEDEDLRQQCIEKGRIHRMKFAPEKVSADMMAVYRSLLDN